MDWLEMAEDEFKDCESDYRDGSYLSAVYPIEQCSQKAIKAVIVTLGFDPGKTHMPTIVLKLLIAGGLVDLKKDHMDLLNKAISYSIALEEQGTVPRYSWEAVDRMIKPSETYDKEKTALLINNAKAVLEIVKKLLGSMNC